MPARRTVSTGARRPPRITRFAALAVAFIATLAGLLVPSAPAAAFDEGAIHSLVNQSRAASGLGPLAHNSALGQVALNWANQMAANNAMTHNPGYSTQIPGGWSRAAENVAQGYPSGPAVHQGWMNSSGHRANILGDFTDVGIAHISAGGTTWSVEVFAKYGGSVPAPAPAPPPPPPAPAPAPAPPPVPAPDAAPPSPEPTPVESAPGAPMAEAEAPSARSSSKPGQRSTPRSSAPNPGVDSAEERVRPDVADSTTRVVLGLALLSSIALAAAGLLRLRTRRGAHHPHRYITKR